MGSLVVATITVLFILKFSVQRVVFSWEEDLAVTVMQMSDGPESYSNIVKRFGCRRD